LKMNRAFGLSSGKRKSETIDPFVSRERTMRVSSGNIA